MAASHFDETQSQVATIDYFRELGHESAHDPGIAFKSRRVTQDTVFARVLLSHHTEVLKQAFLSSLVSDPLLPELRSGEIELDAAEEVV